MHVIDQLERLVGYRRYSNGLSGYVYRRLVTNPGENIEIGRENVDYTEADKINATISPHGLSKESLFYTVDRNTSPRILLGVLAEDPISRDNGNVYVIGDELFSEWPIDTVARQTEQGMVARTGASRRQFGKYVKDIERYIASMLVYEEAVGITYNLPNVIGVSTTNGSKRRDEDIDRISRGLLLAYHVPMEELILDETGLRGEIKRDIRFIQELRASSIDLPGNLVRNYAFYRVLNRLGLSYKDQMDVLQRMSEKQNLRDVHSFNKAMEKARKKGIVSEAESLLRVYHDLKGYRTYFPAVSEF